MACFHPIRGYRTDAGIVFASKTGAAGDLVTVPCRQCIGCRMDKSQDWAVRCMHEAQMSEKNQNSFITLTYRDEDVPDNFSVDIKDWQLFAKRMRKSLGKFRFFMVGEYGDETHRPHMHACIFGHDFRADRKHYTTRNGNKFYRSEALEKLWTKGHSDVTDMTYGTAAYVARYCIKKIDNDQAVHWNGPRTPEFLNMSRRPGIGTSWIEQFGDDVFPSDFVVMGGRKAPAPEYYDDWLEKSNPEMWEELKAERALRGAERIGEKSKERLKVRETVFKAKIRNLKRGM